MGAAAAPAGDSDQAGLAAGDEQRSTVVAAAGVHATGQRSGTDHHGSVEAGAVLCRVRHGGIGLDRKVDLPEVVGGHAALGRVAVADRPYGLPGLTGSTGSAMRAQALVEAVLSRSIATSLSKVEGSQPGWR